MKNAPILTTLDLWALGHSASQIAEMLGFPNHKHVTRIVERARSIGDTRAVLHKAKNGRLIGRPARMMPPPLANVVPALPQKPLCPRGHEKENGRCRICNMIRLQLRRDRGLR